MSRDVVIERVCRAAAASALQAAVKALVGLGYARAAGSARGAQLVSTSGDRHRVAVEADGERLLFRFEGAVLGPPLDAPALERVADAVASAVTGGAVSASGRTVRCPLCATVAEPGQTSCAVCGARLDP